MAHRTDRFYSRFHARVLEQNEQRAGRYGENDQRVAGEVQEFREERLRFVWLGKLWPCSYRFQEPTIYLDTVLVVPNVTIEHRSLVRGIHHDCYAVSVHRVTR